MLFAVYNFVGDSQNLRHGLLRSSDVPLKTLCSAPPPAPRPDTVWYTYIANVMSAKIQFTVHAVKKEKKKKSLPISPPAPSAGRQRRQPPAVLSSRRRKHPVQVSAPPPGLPPLLPLQLPLLLLLLLRPAEPPPARAQQLLLRAALLPQPQRQRLVAVRGRHVRRGLPALIPEEAARAGACRKDNKGRVFLR